MGESKFPDSVSPSPSEDQELEKVKSRLLELEEENKNLAEELKARTADLEMIISQAEHCKRQLGLPAEATITDIQNKIDEMVQLTGLTTELMELEKEVNELRRQRTTIERNIAELKRQQNRVEFETRNVMAKNTRLAGRRRIQPVYMPGSRAGQHHQFMVLPSLPVKEAIPPDFTLMGAKPKRPGSNTGLVPPIKAVRANTQLSMSQGSETMRRSDSIIISKRKGSDDSFRSNNTPTSEISQQSSGEKSSAKPAPPISNSGGKRGFIPFFCIMCRKEITHSNIEMACILHPQPARNRQYMCCKAKSTSPGCCSVQHCFIFKDESNSNIYMKTGNGKYSMAIHITSFN